MAKDKDPEKYPVLLGPQHEDGRQSVLTFTPEGITSGTIGPEGGSDGEPCAKVQVEQHVGPFGTMTVVEGSIRKGPAKVTTDAYRTGWDTIFGSKQEVGQA